MELSCCYYTPEKHKCQYPFGKIGYVVKKRRGNTGKNGRFTKKNDQKTKGSVSDND